MTRHESVSDEYVAQLRAGFLTEAELVKSAQDWNETQRRMVDGTHPYLVAIGRANEGWKRDDIARELDASRLLVTSGNQV